MSTYAVVNPATGETVKEYPEISDGDLRAAIERADAASKGWAQSSTVAERAALVRKVGELHTHEVGDVFQRQTTILTELTQSTAQPPRPQRRPIRFTTRGHVCHPA